MGTKKQIEQEYTQNINKVVRFHKANQRKYNIFMNAKLMSFLRLVCLG